MSSTALHCSDSLPSTDRNFSWIWPWSSSVKPKPPASWICPCSRINFKARFNWSFYHVESQNSATSPSPFNFQVRFQLKFASLGGRLPHLTHSLTWRPDSAEVHFQTTPTYMPQVYFELSSLSILNNFLQFPVLKFCLLKFEEIRCEITSLCRLQKFSLSNEQCVLSAYMDYQTALWSRSGFSLWLSIIFSKVFQT